MTQMSRRAFLKRMAALGWAVLASDAFLGCKRVPSSALPASPTLVARLSPTRPLMPAATSAMAPAPTDAPDPTAAPVDTAAPAPSPSAVLQPSGSGQPYLAVARGPQPAELTRRAIAALGGIERFVRPGANVIIKPNICNAPVSYEQGSTTNPEIVATLVRLCLGAGAGRVRVMDQPFASTPDMGYARSGIADAVRAAGGEMEIMAQMKYREVDIPRGRDLKRWGVYGEILDADLVINVPIAKVHGNTGLTLGCKNLMGVVVDREALHPNLGQRIADITSLVMPALTVVDAIRIMLAHGPQGGSPSDVKMMNTAIASADIVAADAYATRLFDVSPLEVPYIPAAAEMGLGTMDLDTVRIEELQVG